MKFLPALCYCIYWCCPAWSVAQSAPTLLQQLDSLGEVYFYQGDADSSAFYFRQAVVVAGQLHQDAAQLEAYNWLFYLATAAAKTDSLDHYLARMIPLAERLPADVPENAGILSSFWNSKSYYHDQRGEFFEKIQGDQYALRYYEMLPDADSSELAILYQNLGTALEQIGDYFQANAYSRKALELLSPSQNRTNIQLDSLMILNSIGAQLAHLRRYEAAESFFQKGAQVAAALGTKSDGSVKSTAALFQVQWGSNYHHQGNYQAADALFAGAQALLESDHKNSDVFLLLKRYQARNALAKGQAAQAEKLAAQILELIKKHFPDRIDQKAASRELLGDIYFSQQKYAAALTAYQQGLQHLCPDFSTADPTQNPALEGIAYSKTDLLRVLRKKGDALRADDRPGAAFATYQLAVNLFHIIREDFVTEDARLLLSEQTAPLFEQAVDLAVELQETELAFQLVEQSKALLLQEALKDEEAYRLAGVPPALAQQAQQLKVEQTYWEKERFESKIHADHKRLEFAGQKLFESRRRQELLLEKIRLEYPQFLELKYQKDRVTPAGINERFLLPGQALIEYFITGHKVYVFGLTHEGLVIKIVDKDTGFDKRISLILSTLHQEVNTEPMQYAHAAYAFFQRYLAPVLESFSKPVQNLYIIPDGVFSYIPFEALLTAPATRSAYSSFPYLVREYQCSYAYSSALLLRAGSPLIQKNRMFVGFAPDFPATGGPSGSGNDLAPLKYNIEAVNTIRDLTHGTSYTHASAGKANFLQPPAPPLILHLSTHAQLDDQDPLSSRIFLADGDITVREIYNLPYSCNLVVLSACQTGTGKYYKGEGIMSLARAFMQSGSPSVVTSLWKVDDRSTSELMVGFYKNLKKGLPKPEALQQAKLDFLQSKESEMLHHPFYWAAFIHIGETESLVFPKNYSFWILAGLALAALALLLYYGKLRH